MEEREKTKDGPIKIPCSFSIYFQKSNVGPMSTHIVNTAQPLDF